MKNLREHLATTVNGERVELDLVTRQVFKGGEPLTRRTTVSVLTSWKQKKKNEFGEKLNVESRTFEPVIPHNRLTLPLDARNRVNRVPVVD